MMPSIGSFDDVEAVVLGMAQKAGLNGAVAP
jgi:hypothetical protein